MPDQLTDISIPQVVTTAQELLQYEPPSMAKPIAEDINLLIERAEGIYLYDANGRRFIDLTGGSGVANIGYSHPELIKSIQHQTEKLICTGWKIPSNLRIEAAKKILALLPAEYDKILFSVTGSEAIEAALKIARIATGKPTVLSFTGAYHGKTLGSLQVTSRASYKTGATNLDSNNFKLIYPNCNDCFIKDSFPDCNIGCYNFLEYTLNSPSFNRDDIAAIILEPIQGAEGIVIPPKDFICKLHAYCKQHNILLIFDEIFTGFGRTGKLFCYEHFGVLPDLLVAGKALGGGIPISVTIGNHAIMDQLSSYKQTSTFSANPLALSCAVTVLDIMQHENIIDNAAVRGKELLEGLVFLKSKYHFITDVRGMGLMIGVELDATYQPGLAKKFTELALDHGLILLYGGAKSNVLKLTPPLTLDSEEVQEIIEKMQLVFKKLQKI